MEKPREGMKNHGLSKNVKFLLCLDCIMCEKRFLTTRLFLSPTNSLLSFLNLSLGSWVITLQIQLNVPFII